MVSRKNLPAVLPGILFFSITLAVAWIPPAFLEGWLSFDMRSRIVCAAAIILGVSALTRRKTADFRSSDATLLLAAITAFVALYAVIDPNTGDRKNAEFAEALRWIACLAAFFGAANIRGRVTAFRMLRVSLVAIACVALIGVATYSRHLQMPAIAGLCNKQLLAALLAMFVPAAVAMALLGRGKSRLLAAAVLPILLLGLVLAFNRTCWLSSLLGVVAVVSLLRSSTTWRPRVSIIFSRKTLIAATVMLCLCVVAIEYSGFSVSLSPSSALGSILWRSHAASEALSISQSAPLLGTGPGSLAFELQSHGFVHVPETLVAHLGLNAHAHNTYLEMAAELGWPVTLAYCALLLILIKNFWRGFQRCRSERQCIVLISGFGALVVYLVDSMANPAWQYAAISVPLWMLIGVGAGAITPKARARAFVQLRLPTLSPPRWATGMAAIALIGFCPLKSSGGTYAIWPGFTGNWTDATDWSTNPVYPNGNYDAYVGSGNVTLNSSITLNSLTLFDYFNEEAFPTLNQTGGSLQAGTVDINSGTYNLTGGSLQATPTFVGDGTFLDLQNESDPSVTTIAGAGTFTQSGSLTASNLGFLEVGVGTGSSGTISLSGGSLTATTALLGTGGGTATFSQNGSLTVSSLGELIVGNDGGSGGTVTLSAGTLTATYFEIGLEGLGLFKQTGGFSSLGTVGIAESGTATVSLSSGTLICTGMSLGNAVGGAATFSQTGGVSSLGTLQIGFVAPLANTGTVSLSGGSLTATDTGVGDGGAGTFLQTGSNTLSSLGSLTIGSVGFMSVTGGTAALSAGTIASGGTLTVANATFSSSGTLTNQGFIEATGTFSNVLTSSLTNSGSISANASVASFSGSLTNNPGSSFNVSGLAIFSGNVVGAGAFTGNGTADFLSTLNSTQPLVMSGSAAVGLNCTANVPTVRVRNLIVDGTLNFAAGAGTVGTGSISSLLISSGGRLNLNDHGLVINYGVGPSPIGELNPSKHTQTYPSNSIQAYLQTASDDGNWDGSGITSINAENDVTGVTAVGALDSNDLLALQGNNYTGGTWLGQPITSNNTVLVRFTYYGDTNLDGVVNSIDVDNLIQGFEGFGDGWLYGDFNYDGIVDSLDVTEMIIGYSGQGKPLGDAISPGQAQFLLSLEQGLTAAQIAKFDAVVGVPEPTSLSSLAIAAGLLTRRRRRSPAI